MITKKQSEVIKELIGKTFIKKIELFFFENKIIAENGKPYSTQLISSVLNGSYQNTTVEDGIWLYVEKETIRRQEESQKREALIEAAKELTNA